MVKFSPGDEYSTTKRARLSSAEEVTPLMPRKQESGIDLSGSGSDMSIGMAAFIDPETLECCICMETLSAPVFQCSNGHIACSRCCEQLNNKCHSCAKPIGKIRCLAIEKVIESVKVGCKNACSGCTEMVRYSERRDHESKCRYASYLCPVSGCSFTSSSQLFPNHFLTVHGASSMQFSYDAWFTVTLDTDEPFFILEGEDMLFLLQNKMKPLGNLVHIIYFGPVSLEELYTYQIEIKKEKRRLVMESFARSIVGKCETLQDFLLVPIETYEENGQLTFEISFHCL